MIALYVCIPVVYHWGGKPTIRKKSCIMISIMEYCRRLELIFVFLIYGNTSHTNFVYAIDAYLDTYKNVLK